MKREVKKALPEHIIFRCIRKQMKNGKLILKNKFDLVDIVTDSAENVTESTD